MDRKAQSHLSIKLESAAILARAHLPAHLPPVFFLTDPDRTPDPVATAAHLPKGWGIIYRHFGADDRVSTAQALSKIAGKKGLELLIAADPELAKHVNANGVHWPEAQLDRAHKWQGVFDLSTASAHSFDTANTAALAGMDAVLRSTVFPSNSPSASVHIGADALKAEALNSPIPIYALGGINANNAESIANFAGLAAIECIESAYAPRI